jgi:hypothetical protein
MPGTLAHSQLALGQAHVTPEIIERELHNYPEYMRGGEFFKRLLFFVVETVFVQKLKFPNNFTEVFKQL